MADIFYSERPPVTSLDTGFTDVSESWLQPVISRALSYNIISSSRRFQPDRYTTRLDAYTMIMNAVCMERPVLSAVQARPDLIYQTALDNGLTTRPSLRDFQPNGLISRQEMYIVIGRAAEWVEKTGGCQPIVNSCRKS